jgi:hypothetical protein
VQVRRAQGARVPADDLHQLRRQDHDRPPARGDGHLRRVRLRQQEPRHEVRHLRQPGRPAAQVHDPGLPGAGHDLRRAAQGHLPAVRLRQGPRDRRPHDARRQGGGGLLRRHPADDGQRHVRDQRHRAGDRLAAPPFPGVFFTKEGPRSYLAKIIPYRGSWVEFEYDQKDVLSVRIDRKRKFHGTVFLRALGLESDESILRQFYTGVGSAPRGRRQGLHPAGAAQGPRAGAHEGPPEPRPPRQPTRCSPASRWPRRRSASRDGAEPGGRGRHRRARAGDVHRRRRRPGHRRGDLRGQRAGAGGPRRAARGQGPHAASRCSSPTGSSPAPRSRTRWPRTTRATPRNR